MLCLAQLYPCCLILFLFCCAVVFLGVAVIEEVLSSFAGDVVFTGS